MTSVPDMTDEEWWLHQARQWAGRRYRAEGHNEFAERVEKGYEDSCSLVRLGRFFIEPSLPPSAEYIGAWDEFSIREHRA